MQRLWSPWRSQYIATFKKPKSRRKSSLFTDAVRDGDDSRHLIVWRGKTCFVIMNRFPYNSGHLMIVPYRQVVDLRALSPEELTEIMVTAQRCVRALDEVMGAQGYNFGANLGHVSGAGIDNHIHFHLVPRWNGDTNFMPVLADTKVVSEDMKRTLRKLKKAFKHA